MNFFEDLKASTYHKWLDYYRLNRSWIRRISGWQVKIAEGGNRPNSFIILSAISVLEPDLLQLLPSFGKLNGNPDYIVEVLGLNFDPEQALDRLQSQNAKLLEGHNDE